MSHAPPPPAPKNEKKSSNSSSSSLFSRTSSIFVSNRRRAEQQQRDQRPPLNISSPQQLDHTTSHTWKTAAFSISPPIAEAEEAPPHTPELRSISNTPTPPLDEKDRAKSPPASRSAHSHHRLPSETSIPPDFIPTRTSSRSSKRHRHSSSAGGIDLSSLRRSVSLRSVSSPHNKHSRTPSHQSLALSASVENIQTSDRPATKPLLHIPAFTKRQKSADALSAISADTTSTFGSTLEGSRSGNMMNGVPYGARQTAGPTGRAPGASISSVQTSYSASSNGTNMTFPQAGAGASAGGQTPQMVYQHIMDTASKRISTLDYLRKAHEGRVYWFNTLLFTKPDLLKFPFFSPQKLARRATNYLHLGFSLPTILDLNSQTPTEYLKALNALLLEFETYQTLHPPDGSVPSSLSRARVVPQMFKRNINIPGKNRRTSSAADYASSSSDPHSGSAYSSTTSFLSSPSNAHPQDHHTGENYIHLLTPPLPFDPDFFETFATLCDVLIDCYTKVTTLIKGPEMCAGNVGELFGKADARVRKVVVAGVVREFEERCREGVRGEVAGVGRVVLGGLM